MKRITTLLALCLALIFLSSCSTSTLYYKPLSQRPSGNWQGSSSAWGGYTETKLSSQHYKVGFEAYNRPGPEVAKHFSLLRAAERAAIDGRKSFYLSSAKLRTSKPKSHFPKRYEPAYTTTEIEHYDTVAPCGEVIHHTREITTYHPEKYYPPYSITNHVYNVSRELHYQRKVGSSYSTYAILSSALNDDQKLGKPKLDPRALQQVNAWAEEIKKR